MIVKYLQMVTNVGSCTAYRGSLQALLKGVQRRQQTEASFNTVSHCQLPVFILEAMLAIFHTIVGRHTRTRWFNCLPYR